jgi:xanthine dehydrogenase accessory factor
MNIIAPGEPVPQSASRASHDPIEAAREWLHRYGKVAIATVASTWGSAPVPVGGQLVVAPDESFEGSVSGGCIEGDVIVEAVDAMAGGRPRLIEFGVADETAWRAGLSCGGKIKVLIEPLARARDAGYLDRILDARRARRPLVVVTDTVTGSRALFEGGAEGGEEVKGALASGESRLIEKPSGATFVQALMPPVRLIIAGATNISQVLAGLAKQAGYDVVIADPRAAFLTPERFAGFKTIGAWPATSLTSVGLDSRTAVVALTHASHIDDEALAIALRSPSCLYIGALGSRATHAKRVERLREAGFSESDVDRIHAPIGLAIGAKGPAEIAVSILAEIIKVARGAA